MLGKLSGLSIVAALALIVAWGDYDRADAAGPPSASGSPAVSAAVTTKTNDNAPVQGIGEYIEANCPYLTSTTVSFTSASPTVGTWAAAPWTGTGTYTCPITITANAPTGLSTATTYYITPVTATTFKVSTSVANAIAGTFVNTSGTSSTANVNSATALSTTVGQSGAAVSLTAGDWDCDGSTYYVPASSTSITNLLEGVGTSASAAGAFGTYADFETAANVVTATNNPVMQTPTVRESLAATTTINAVNIATFTASTLGATSDLRCRRVR